MLVSNKLKEQLLESAIKQEYTGLKLLDAYIADGLGETRFAMECELKALEEAKNKLKLDSKQYDLLIKEVA